MPEPIRINEVIEECRGIRPDVLKEALAIHKRKSNFFPTVHEIRSIIAQPLIDLIPLAIDAWGEVSKAISMVGSYKQPEWSHPLIKRAVDSIGWKIICTDEDLKTSRAHFLRCYEQARNREVQAIIEGRETFDRLQLVDAPALPEARIEAPKLNLRGME